MSGDIDGAEQMYRSILLANSASIEGNLSLGMFLWDHNTDRGRPMTEANPFLERVFNIDPGYPGVFPILRFAYLMDGDVAGLERALDRLDLNNNTWAYIIACGTDDVAEQERILEVMRSGNSSEEIKRGQHVNRVFIIPMLLSIPANHRNIRGHLERMPDSTRTPVEKLLASLTLAYAEAGLGNWEGARAHFGNAPEGYQLHAVEHQAMVMLMPFLKVPDSEIREMIGILKNWPEHDKGIVFDTQTLETGYDRFGPHFELHDHILLYLMSVLHARVGEFALARESADRLDGLEPRGNTEATAANLRISARATIAYMEGDFEDSVRLLETLGSPAQKYALFYNQIWDGFLRAMSLIELEQGSEALRWLGLIKVEFGLTMTAQEHLYRARIFELYGNADQAIEHYNQFIDLWRDAAPELQPRVEEARDRVGALSS